MKPSPPPTVDEYIVSAHRLAVLVRATVDAPKSIKRAEIVKALERFEKVDYRAL